MENTTVIEDQLKTMQATVLAELKELKSAAEQEQKKFGTMLSETKAKLEALQRQADGIDSKIADHHTATESVESLRQVLEKNDDIQRLIRDKRGPCVLTFDEKQMARFFERKTAITSGDVGYGSTGVLSIERTPRIVEEARQQLTVRDVLTSRPTTMQVVDFVKVNSPMTTASPQQGEGHTKKENAVTFVSASERVKTISTWIPASRQVLDDVAELVGFLKTSLAYYVDLMEEQQLLTGSGSGEDLNGLITQATPFNTGLLPLSGSYNRIDLIGRVIQQITSAKELQPTFLVINPVDWWSIRLTKDGMGRYILGDPMGPVAQEQLFGLTPVITTSVAVGTFLIGSGSPIATEIRDRMGMVVEIAREHEDYFARNLVAILAEKRLALIVYRPASFIKGSFLSSP